MKIAYEIIILPETPEEEPLAEEMLRTLDERPDYIQALNDATTLEMRTNISYTPPTLQTEGVLKVLSEIRGQVSVSYTTDPEEFPEPFPSYLRS